MSFEKALEMLVSKLSGWFQQFILVLPNLAIAVIIVMVFLLLALAKNLSLQLLGRVSPTEEVNRLLGALIFLSLFTVGVFMALGIVGLAKRSPHFWLAPAFSLWLSASPSRTSPPIS